MFSEIDGIFIYPLLLLQYHLSFRPLPKFKMSLFLLPSYTDELLLTPNITKFLPNLSPLENEKAERASNPVPYPE